jgi:hypothetical protein
MGGGGGDGGAGQARADEQARQEKIRQGTTNINNIFDGYDKTYGDQLVDPAAYHDGSTYYTDTGSEYAYHAPAVKPENPSAQGATLLANNTPGAGKPLAAMMVPEHLYAAKKTDHVDGQFDDDFYNSRKQAYLDYATPQLNDQYADAQKQLTYALDRSGTLDSSIRAQKEGELTKLYDTNRRGVADQGLSYENQSRSNVEDARAGLIQTLNATGDAEGAANSAVARSKALSAADSYNPLGQLFATFTNGLGSQVQAERVQSLGGPAAAYNTGLFGAKKNAVQTST